MQNLCTQKWLVNGVCVCGFGKKGAAAAPPAATPIKSFLKPPAATATPATPAKPTPTTTPARGLAATMPNVRKQESPASTPNKGPVASLKAEESLSASSGSTPKKERKGSFQFWAEQEAAAARLREEKAKVESDLQREREREHDRRELVKKKFEQSSHVSLESYAKMVRASNQVRELSSR